MKFTSSERFRKCEFNGVNFIEIAYVFFEILREKFDEKLEMKVILIRGVSEMKAIRRKVIFAKRNHVQTSCTVLIIYVLPQYNTVRIYKTV